MGWFGNLLDKISIKRITGRYMDINGGTPIFSQFGQDIYAMFSPIIATAEIVTSESHS